MHEKRCRKMKQGKIRVLERFAGCLQFYKRAEMVDQKFQEAKQEFFWTWALIIIAFSLTFMYVRVRQARRRKQVQLHKPVYVNRQKIILALEINQFCVKYSQRPQQGYLPLELEENSNWLVRTYKKLFKLSHYYKPLYAIGKIKDFFQGLSDLKKVELMLYSSMSPKVAEAIMVKLQIDRCIPKQKRKFCDLENDDDQKHAIQVDQDSRRVIIITPSYDDHTFEDEKYFLVLRPKPMELNYLRDTLRMLKSFVENNQDLNMLHEELGDFKVNVESEMSDFEM